MMTLIPASERDLNSRAAVPTAFAIPCPTVATSAIPSWVRTESGLTSARMSETIFSSTPPARYLSSMTMERVSMPVGRCSKETP